MSAGHTIAIGSRIAGRLRWVQPLLTIILLLAVLVAMRSPPQQDTVRATVFELVDSQGQVVGTLRGSPMGLQIAFPSGGEVLVTPQPGFIFRDANGAEVPPFAGRKIWPREWATLAMRSATGSLSQEAPWGCSRPGRSLPRAAFAGSPSTSPKGWSSTAPSRESSNAPLAASDPIARIPVPLGAHVDRVHLGNGFGTSLRSRSGDTRDARGHVRRREPCGRQRTFLLGHRRRRGVGVRSRPDGVSFRVRIGRR